MKRHASMNRIYRLVWSQVLGAWVAVAETARGRGKSSARRLIAAALLTLPVVAQAGPVGGQLVAGVGSISQAAATTTVSQISQNAIINWQSFGIAAGESVIFHQPSASSVALNRVIGNSSSQIYGSLAANGQVFLVNPNGVLFGPSARVDVGGLVASTLSIGDTDFLAGKLNFANPGNVGSVINQGRLTAAPGGYIALIAPVVTNSGTITTNNGSAALASGDKLTLDFDGDNLLKIKVDAAAVSAQVINSGAIVADGGRVSLTARAAGNLLGSVINNAGTVQARSMVVRNGEIVLDGGTNGSVGVSGTLDVSGDEARARGGSIGVFGQNIVLQGASLNASGQTGGGSVRVGGDFHGAATQALGNPVANAQSVAVDAASVIKADAGVQGDGGRVVLWSEGSTRFDGSISARGGAQSGSGGNVETSGASLKVGSQARVNTLAANGLTGSWLLDPVDFTIAASGGDITGAALGALLGANNVTLHTAAGVNTATDRYGTTGTAGNINVNDAVTWDTHTLTLTASNDVNINAVMTANNAALVLTPATTKVNVGFNSDGSFKGRVDFFLADGTTPRSGAGFLTMNGVGYTVITALGAQGSVTALDLQGMSGGLAGKYALGANIDATATSGWNAPSGFLPVSTFTGKFDGLGHTITNLFINRPATDLVGLFGLINAATVRNVGMVGGTITGRDGTGALAGNDFESPTYNNYATGAVTGRYSVGGLLGETNYNCCDPIHPSVSNSHATGAVTGSYYGGGLIGFANSPTISNSYATGNVTSTAALHSYFGGLLGYSNSATVSNSYATGNVSAAGNTKVGGLVGYAAGNGLFTDVYATGSVTGSDYVGGLVGRGAYGNAVNRAYASGAVSGSSYVGGLVGQSATGATVSNSYWDIGASGQAASPGGGTGVGALGVSPTADMKKLATFSGSWGANVSATSGGASTWRIYEGSTAPLLRSYLTPLTVTANDAVKTYDGLAYSGAGGVSYSTAPNGNLLGSVSYSSGVNVGSSAITPSGLYSNQQGYDVSYINGTLTINKANLTLSGARAYDGTTVVAGAVITANGVNGESFTVTGLGNATNLASKDVQMGSTLASITGLSLGPDNGAALSSNYNGLSTVGSSITINKAHLTVTANDANRLYGAANPALTTTVTGFVNGQGTGTAAGYGGAGTATTLADVNTNVGTATITAGAGTLTANNYDFPTVVNGTLTIGKATATLTASKTYDGGVNFTGGQITVSGVNGETLALNGAGPATANSKDVANNATNYLTAMGGMTLADGTGLAANYQLPSLAARSANNQATIVAAGLHLLDYTGSKVYDGSASFAFGQLAIAPSSILGTDDVSLASGAASVASKNAGHYAAFVANTLGLGGVDAGNYSAVGGAVSVDITAKPVTLTAPVVSKTYDGGLAYTATPGNLAALGGALVGGDSVIAATIAYTSKNAGSGNKVVSLNAATISDGNGGANYTVTLAGNATSSIDRAPLTLFAQANSKTYDGSTSATAVPVVAGLQPGDSVTDRAETYDNPNAGTGKTLSVSAYTVNDGNGGANYTVSAVNNLAGIINAAVVIPSITSVSGSFTAANKVYDGTTAATIIARNLAGVIGGDDVHLTGGSASFADKNVGQAKLVTATGLYLTGAAAGNYTANSTATTTADITARPLTVTAIAANKVYDATTTASVALHDNRVAGDALSTSYAAANFNSKDVGTGKTVTVSGIGVTGLDAINYRLLSNSAATTADITAASLAASLGVGISAANKVYDGTTAATITNRTLTGVLGADDVHLAGGTANFADKNVGQAKLVTATGLYLIGSAAANYTAASTATTTASISAKPLTPSASTASKVYDATTAATITNRTLVGVIGADDVTLAGGTASFADKNVGVGKLVTATGLYLTGSSAGNYTAASTATTTATISAKPLTLTASAANKVYDATTAATLTARTLTGVIGADDVSLAGGTASFADKNVGTAKLVTATGLYLTGTAAGNYTAASTTTTSADVSAKPLTLTTSVASKVYDGSTAANLTDRSLAGVIGNDDVTLAGGTASFADKNVGQAKLVTATGLYLTGSAAGNYTAASTATTSADITARALTVVATGVNKTYDRTTAATVSLADDRIYGDALATNYGAATFDNKNVGQAKTVTVSGIGISGLDAINYRLVSSTATTTADISAAAVLASLSAGVAADSKVYDGTTAATITARTLAGVIADDEVQLVGGTAAFADKNVGTAKLVTATGLYLTGAAAMNYTANSTATTTADITARPLTVAATASSKVYDGTTAASVSLADNRLSGDLVNTSYAAASFDNPNVGTAKPVTASGIVLSGPDARNYQLQASAASSAADVTARPLTITAQDQTKVYGDADPTLTYLTGGMGLIATDHLTGALSSAPGESVAAYAIDQGSLSAGPNYAIAFRGATLAITPAQLLYLADPATRSAGQANPLFSGAVTGFKFNDSLANATSGALLFTSPATAASPVGSYPIEGHGLTARNYLFAQASTNATALTVAAAPAATVLPPPSDPPAAPLLAATATDPSLLERLLDPLVPCKSTMVANADGGFSIVAVCSD